MRYGDRLKVDMSPGRMVIFVEEDLWVLYFPRIFGTIKFFVSQSIESNRVQYDQNPACFNVLDAIRDMTLGRRNALPNNEAVHVFEKFMLGFRAISLLEGTMTHKLIKSALADISSSVDQLMDKSKQYGLSKWSSLQAAEKIMKAALDLKGASFPKIHNLRDLTKEARKHGIVGDWDMLINHIQCTPSIRYGDESCDRISALLAHNSLFGLIVLLVESGAPFKSSVSIKQTKR
jgi:hypothetical protein